MATLHLVNKASALAACMSVVSAEDAIVLLEDGVYAGTAGLAPDRRLHALAPDVIARGLSGRLAPRVEVVSDDGFVALVEAHQPVVTWR